MDPSSVFIPLATSQQAIPLGYTNGCIPTHLYGHILAIHPLLSCLRRSTDATQKKKASSGHINVTNVTYRPPSPSHPTQPNLTKGRGDDGRGTPTFLASDNN